MVNMAHACRITALPLTAAAGMNSDTVHAMPLMWLRWLLNKHHIEQLGGWNQPEEMARENHKKSFPPLVWAYRCKKHSYTLGLDLGKRYSLEIRVVVEYRQTGQRWLDRVMVSFLMIEDKNLHCLGYYGCDLAQVLGYLVLWFLSVMAVLLKCFCTTRQQLFILKLPQLGLCVFLGCKDQQGTQGFQRAWALRLLTD